MALIEVSHVSKHFHARRGPQMLLARGGFVNLFKFNQHREEKVVLSDISFTVERGESVGIIGSNGSGKSTLLKMLAGVMVPTAGDVRIHGRVASLLELGAGFHPLLTGRENIYLNAGLLGMRRPQIEEVFDKIVEFSGIRDFIDNPVNTYSSGMYVRLGFAVAVHANPDIFLVDEVLSVGDEEFQRKCRRRIGELKEEGKTIVFVSHDLSIVNTLCDRVILLSRGKMVVRSTPRDTIEYYLRLIGMDEGIHTVAAGALEAITNHGQLSSFWKQQEVTTPLGMQTQINSMGQWHSSTLAEWQVLERGESHCLAKGQMAKLPVTWYWDLTLEQGKMIWKIAIHCERDMDIKHMNIAMHFPTVYTQWFYGAQAGIFNDIQVTDTQWLNATDTSLDCDEMGILPQEQSALPPVIVSLLRHKPYCTLACANTDYILSTRVLRVDINPAESDLPFTAGRHDLIELTLDFGLSPEQFWAYAQSLSERAKALETERMKRLKEKEVERTVYVGDLAAFFDNGNIHLLYKGQELTSFIYCYASMLIGNLWNDSHHFFWKPYERDGQQITITGESRRFPFRQHWRMQAVPEGIRLTIQLEALDAFDVHEYHTSVVLKAEYTQWETQYESGPFPNVEPGVAEWRHANRNYAPGEYAKAKSNSPLLPTVVFRPLAKDIPFRMTTINTGFSENARVLQALRVPDAGLLHFEKGMHLYFDGVISVEEE